MLRNRPIWSHSNFQVGAQGLDPLISVLERDSADEEILSYALDTISNICSPDEFEEELLAAKNENGRRVYLVRRFVPIGQ